MKIIVGVLMVAALAFGSGCAKTDWIERTLVTVDVTGTWQGRFPGFGGVGDVLFELEQQGSTVKGFMRIGGPGYVGVTSGPIDGTVAGDVFRFKNTRGSVDGELTVSGDEMNGQASVSGASRAVSLRRVESFSRPDSPRR
jgi:hypothetical protein